MLARFPCDARTRVAAQITYSGGVFPNSVALSGDFVYVLNKNGTTPNITGFRMDTIGTLHWIATVPLPPGSAGANDVRFSPDGTRLLLTESGTNEILVFPIASDGVASSPVVQASAGGSPFGIRFGHDGIVVVSEAAGSASSYRSGDGDTLEIISCAVNDTQKASCWISLTRAASYAYLSNTGSRTLSSFQVGSNGELTLASAVDANPGGTPIDSSLSLVIHTLKRLASAVQLRPWPPCFQSLSYLQETNHVSKRCNSLGWLTESA